MQQCGRKEIGWNAGKPLSTVEGMGRVELVVLGTALESSRQICRYCRISELFLYIYALELSIDEILRDGPFQGCSKMPPLPERFLFGEAQNVRTGRMRSCNQRK